MSQDQISGAAANQWGRKTARIVAESIGAQMVSRDSNECIYEGDKVVIKCAKMATNSVGVTYKMLERIKFVAGAFQMENGKFALWKLSASIFSGQMRATASQGSAKRKVGIVQKSVFEAKGTALDSIYLSEQN